MGSSPYYIFVSLVSIMLQTLFLSIFLPSTTIYIVCVFRKKSLMERLLGFSSSFWLVATISFHLLSTHLLFSCGSLTVNCNIIYGQNIYKSVNAAELRLAWNMSSHFFFTKTYTKAGRHKAERLFFHNLLFIGFNRFVWLEKFFLRKKAESRAWKIWDWTLVYKEEKSILF